MGKITKEKEKRETGFVDVTDSEYPNIRSLEKQDYADKKFGVVDFVNKKEDPPLSKTE